MVEELKKMGFTNAVYVPNSKKIDYYPVIKRKDDGMIKFVFLSRIHPQKWCEMILDCTRRLNELGYEDKFIVDFYGNIFSEYEKHFLQQCDDIPNVVYKGYLNLITHEGYDILSTYNMMLFPTSWWGEGFPGVIIDSYVCGLPLIESDWNFNCEIIDDITGIIIPPNDEELLREMKNTIDGKYDLNTLSKNCQERCSQYDINHVLSESNLQCLGLLQHEKYRILIQSM